MGAYLFSNRFVLSFKKIFVKQIIESFNLEWKIEFEALKAVFSKLLCNYSIDIQHVGSTAIPNMYAKPILDIDIIIEDRKLLIPISKSLEDIGYLNKGEQGIEGRFAFRQKSDSVPKTEIAKKWKEHHLYVCYSDSTALKNHILFRDALLNDTNLANEYCNIKLNLSNQEGITREIYTKQKTDFIISALQRLGLDKNSLDEIKKANTSISII